MPRIDIGGHSQDPCKSSYVIRTTVVRMGTPGKRTLTRVEEYKPGSKTWPDETEYLTNNVRKVTSYKEKVYYWYSTQYVTVIETITITDACGNLIRSESASRDSSITVITKEVRHQKSVKYYQQGAWEPYQTINDVYSRFYDEQGAQIAWKQGFSFDIGPWYEPPPINIDHLFDGSATVYPGAKPETGDKPELGAPVSGGADTMLSESASEESKSEPSDGQPSKAQKTILFDLNVNQTNSSVMADIRSTGWGTGSSFDPVYSDFGSVISAFRDAGMNNYASDLERWMDAEGWNLSTTVIVRPKVTGSSQIQYGQ